MTRRTFATLGVSLTLDHGRGEHHVQLARGGLVIQDWRHHVAKAADRQYADVEVMLTLLDAIEKMERGAH